ncbi:MAG: preprotein translocase subunit SecY [Chloroherpetonaceae bacterium]|nr:preprotein translocase subunit SecY [Chthonomonadaceae bacterium]MDW8207922.1 preprotein translocase subunit SecY [Chloroherpetonaceae bacterium]
MIEALQRAFSIPELRQRLLFVLGAFMVFAIGAHIPVPGLDHKKLEGVLSSMGGLLSLVDVFSGGALRRTSIFAMGITPYINASIIMQVMAIAIPQLEQMQKEGEAGRKRLARITRRLTVGLAAMQAFGLTVMFASGGVNIPLTARIQIVVTLTAGSMFLLWLGEQVTQKGVGNGVSLMIFASILLSLPYQVNQIVAQLRAGTVSWFMVLFLIAVFIATIYAVVYITQGTRRIPIQHTKRVIGMRQTQAGASYLPIKVNSAGVIPIIFAISLLLFPATVVNAFPGQTGFIGWLKEAVNYLQPGNNAFATLLYALLVIGFTYFYTSIVMNVQEMADNLKKYGNYIPGIRPGKPTFEYLERVISRITLAGAVFLALIAVLQYILPGMSQFRSFSLIGGTSLLIVVGVAIETMQAIEAQLLMRNYEGFIKSGGQRSTIGGR